MIQSVKHKSISKDFLPQFSLERFNCAHVSKAITGADGSQQTITDPVLHDGK